MSSIRILASINPEIYRLVLEGKKNKSQVIETALIKAYMQPRDEKAYYGFKSRNLLGNSGINNLAV